MMGSLRLFIHHCRLLICCLLIIDKCYGTSHCSQDPCVSNAVTLLQKENRAENCPDVQFSNCDAYISPGWYRTDTPMLNYCPTNALGLSCGTTFPAWMNGSDPSEIDGAVVREVCLKGPTTSCQSTYSIQVKNCTSFMAYCLRPLNSCPERYCFGTFGICLSTSSSTATTTTTANSHLHNTGNRDAGKLEPGLTPHRNSTNVHGSNDSLQNETTGVILTALVCISILAAFIIISFITMCFRRKRERPSKSNILTVNAKKLTVVPKNHDANLKNTQVEENENRKNEKTQETNERTMYSRHLRKNPNGQVTEVEESRFTENTHGEYWKTKTFHSEQSMKNQIDHITYVN